MRKSISWITPAVVISTAVVTALALDRPVSIIPQARASGLSAEAEAQCPRGDATLHGAYMSQGGGSIIGVGPITFQGTVYLDGKGGVVNPFTASFNGTILRLVAPGTYTVASDCTGTMELGGTDHFDIRISPDGSRIDYIKTDAGAIVSGRATRMQD
ncbi:MAG: hypothetical protein JO274_13250 [Gammaproteobacteria bacterium]|nr:hypothetical protein [Gammaproteobacteria bacterium]